MELIIDFYKGLDTLNLIIFWGVIIVIILLLIFSFILTNKNKKLKKLIDKDKKDNEEKTSQKELEIPVKNEEVTKSITLEKTENEEEKEIVLPPIPEMPKEEENLNKPLETEKKFVAEEHVMEYNKDLFSLSNIKKNDEPNEQKTNEQQKEKKPLEMPTGPYQRNVLREMSLSQTSPIGINRQERKEEKRVEMAKDLEESLNNKQEEIFPTKEEITKEQPKLQEINEKVKEELTKIENPSPRKTEIKTESIIVAKQESKETEKKVEEPENKTTESRKLNNDYIDPRTKELLTKETLPKREQPEKTSSEKYLEEVSRKLAEAEIPDEIERTNYELKQEEDAIISYKELMEKKDSIQTIDEEEAVISIEELMNRSNQKAEEKKEIKVPAKEDSKLYNISEDEENDNFLKELKQFRNDL